MPATDKNSHKGVSRCQDCMQGTGNEAAHNIFGAHNLCLESQFPASFTKDSMTPTGQQSSRAPGPQDNTHSTIPLVWDQAWVARELQGLCK